MVRLAIPALLILCAALAGSGCSIVPQVTSTVTSTTQSSIAGLANTLHFWGDGEGKDAKKQADPAEAPTPAMSEPKIVGTVRFSYEDFALIYTPTKVDIAPGTLVTVLGKDGEPQDVEMRISAERKDAFLVADLVRGRPKSQQLVVTKSVPIATGASSVEDVQVLP